MGVDIGRWRSAIGRFGGGRDYRTAVKRNLLQKLLLHDEELVRILLLLAGIERNPGPTNQETLNWLKSVQSARQDAEAAKTFFGNFPFNHCNFIACKEKFLIEHKRVRQEAHTRLLKSCAGSGNQGMEPPQVFVPHDMMSEGRCTICEKSFSNEDDLKITFLMNSVKRQK